MAKPGYEYRVRERRTVIKGMDGSAKMYIDDAQSLISLIKLYPSVSVPTFTVGTALSIVASIPVTGLTVNDMVTCNIPSNAQVVAFIPGQPGANILRVKMVNTDSANEIVIPAGNWKVLAIRVEAP